MASARLQKWLDNCRKDIRHEKFNGCVKARVDKIKPLTDQAIIIASEIFSVKITLQYGSGQTWSFNAVAKLEPTDDGFGKFVREKGFFNTEIKVYMETLKHMEKLGSKKNVDSLAPVCYHAADGVLLLEDLKVNGYNIVSTNKLLDYDQTTLALRRLGEFHAMSLVMMEQGTLIPNSFKPIIYQDKENMMVPTMASAVSSIADFIKNEWGPEWTEVPGRMIQSTKNLGDKLADLVRQLNKKCEVLCHGDFTMRNMLFKISENGEKPCRVKFIDFQGSCWANPIFDIVVFLNSSMIPSNKDENLSSLLQIYCESLREICSINAYQGVVPTIKEVTEWYETASFYGAVTALFALPIFLGNQSDNTPDLENSDKNQSGSLELHKKSYFKSKITEEHLKYVIKRCMDKNIF